MYNFIGKARGFFPGCKKSSRATQFKCMSSQILHIHHPAICTTLWLKHGLSCGLSSAFQFHHDYWVYQVYQVYIKAHTGAFCVAPDPDHPPKEPAQPDRNPGGAENCPPHSSILDEIALLLFCLSMPLKGTGRPLHKHGS